MAIIEEMEEEAGQQNQATSVFDASGIEQALYPLLARRGPRGLLKVVVDFLRRRSDAFKSDFAYSELVAVLSAAKEEEDSAASRAAASEKRNVAEKRSGEEKASPVTSTADSSSAPAPAPPEVTSSSKESEAGEGQEERKASGAVKADSGGKDLRVVVAEPIVVPEVVAVPGAGQPVDVGGAGPSAGLEKAAPAGPEGVPEDFPALGIKWPEGPNSTDDPWSTGVAAHLMKSAEELLETRPLPSVEKMRAWLDVRTRSYHAFGGPRDLWMAKLTLIWEEFGRLCAVQRRREQIQAMFDEASEKHRTLLTAEAEAEAEAAAVDEQLRLLQAKTGAAHRRVEELAREVAQSRAHLSDLEKRKA